MYGPRVDYCRQIQWTTRPVDSLLSESALNAGCVVSIPRLNVVTPRGESGHFLCFYGEFMAPLDVEVLKHFVLHHGDKYRR